MKNSEISSFRFKPIVLLEIVLPSHSSRIGENLFKFAIPVNKSRHKTTRKLVGGRQIPAICGQISTAPLAQLPDGLIPHDLFPDGLMPELVQY